MNINHVKSIPQKSEFKYSCFDCGKEVVNKEDLIVHKRKHNFKIKQCKHYRAKGFCHFGEACHYTHNKNEINQNFQQNNFKYKKKSKQICTNGLSCFWLARNKCLFTLNEQNIQNEGKILNSKSNIASKDQLKDNDNLIRLILTKLSDLEKKIEEKQSSTHLEL